MNQIDKKATEKSQVELFLQGLIEFNSIEAWEKPDFWVHRQDLPSIALEVTEYHPLADEVEGIRRKEIESRWCDSLEPKLDSIRKTKPELRNIQVSLEFNDLRLPKKGEHERISKELVALVKTLLFSNSIQKEGNKYFFISGAAPEILKSFAGGWKILPVEKWPYCAQHFSSVSVKVSSEMAKMEIDAMPDVDRRARVQLLLPD